MPVCANRRLQFASWLAVLGLLAMFFSQMSCQQVANNPSPRLTSITPASIPSSSPGFTMTVTGSGFAPQSVVEFNGSQRVGNTLFLGTGELTTMISPAELLTPATITVQVFTPSPGGGTSNSVDFTITNGQSLLPQITSISPSTAFAGGTGLTLTVFGSNFNTTSVVALNNNNRATNYVNGGELQATISSTDLQSSTTYQVSVTNPPPGGGSSNTVSLAITNPAPIISLVSPSTDSVQASGNSGLTVSVDGQGFDMASQIYFNGTARTTSFIANSLVTAVLNDTDLTVAGTFPVVVINPAPGGGTSNASGFSVLAGASGMGLPQQINVSTAGVQGDAGTTDTVSSGPVISSNGQYIAFASGATNLTAGDTNGFPDVFLQNNCQQLTSLCVPSTVLISISGTNSASNGASSEPSMDSTGRYLTFTSNATNLIPGNNRFTGVKEVYWRDTCTGVTTTCTPRNLLASVASDGLTPANADSYQSSLSPDGRYVAYVSAATNLSEDSGGVSQIFLYDTCNGASACTPSTTLLSIAPDGLTPGDGASTQPALGNNALYVAFTSAATNLLSSSVSGPQQIYLRSTCVGVSSGCTPATALISTPDGTTLANGTSFTPTLSTDGRIIAFASTATNLTSAATSGIQEVYFRDACTGASSCTPVTSLVSVATDGTTPGNAASEHPSLNSTGQYIAFASFATNLVTTDTNNAEDAFVRNTCAAQSSGCTAATSLVSNSAPQGSGSMGVQGNSNSLATALSADNHSVAFISAATNLLPYGVNNQNNVFLAYTTF